MVYFDNAATTAVSELALKEMSPYFSQKYGNASSLHQYGQEASQALSKARQTVTQILGAKPSEIFFTGGASESNNWMIKGVVEAASSLLPAGAKPHLIVSPIEHHCVLDTAEYLEQSGQAQVSWLSVDSAGLVGPRDIISLIQDNTVLVSVMYVNNEIGTIEPIAEIGAALREYNSQNRSVSPLTSHLPLPIAFHTDAVQAVQYLDCRVDRLGVDALSLSAHKFHGPKGVGIAFIRQGTKIARFIHGGAQEANQRAGTENVSGIVGLEAALLEAANNRQKNFEHVSQLQKSLIDQVLRIDNVQLTGPLPGRHRVPHIASFVVSGVDGEALLLRLDSEGFAVSSGSACTSASLDPSHVLLAIGVGEAESHGSIRVSLSSYNTQEEVDQFVVAFKKVIKEVRALAPRLS